jgi:uncharacterized protein YdaU (DUF1376 family)
MHYYTFHAKDYLADTAHLSNEEDLAYRRMLDLAYTVEGPVPGDAMVISRRIRVPIEAVQAVLGEFWKQTPEGWVNNRVIEELLKLQHHIEDKKKAAKRRWDKWREQNHAGAMQVHSDCSAGAMQVQCTRHPEGMLPINPLTQSISIGEAEDFARGQNLPTDAIAEWHAHRSSQNWEKTSGVKITDWRSDLKAWIYRNARTARPTTKTKNSDQSKYADHF